MFLLLDIIIKISYYLQLYSKVELTEGNKIIFFFINQNLIKFDNFRPNLALFDQFNLLASTIGILLKKTFKFLKLFSMKFSEVLDKLYKSVLSCTIRFSLTTISFCPLSSIIIIVINVPFSCCSKTLLRLY